MIKITAPEAPPTCEPIAIAELVKGCGGSQSEAARIIGVSPTVISRALREDKVKTAFEMAARSVVRPAIDAEQAETVLICVVPSEKRALLETFLRGAGIVKYDIADLTREGEQ